MRWKCICSYDGTTFNGWQSQPTANTIQDVLEKRLEFVFGKPIRIHGSGRTDAGVHANWQVFHFDADWRYGAESLIAAFRGGIPKTVCVFSAKSVTNSFHARYSVHRKRYKYFLREGDPSPFDFRYVWCLGKRCLDIDKMNRVAEKFLGEHDFSMFGAGHADNATENTKKTIHEMRFVPNGDGIVLITEGSGYLYKMVRILVGCFVQVGLGNMDGDKIVAAMDSPNGNGIDFKKQCAPPHGLFLDMVYYGHFV
jgi:tRNA pseudouridine38-40 synthase